MSALRILVIGDPHFKADNARETSMMTKQIMGIIVERNIDTVVVLGDTLHRHEKIDLHPLRRAVTFFRDIQKLVHLYVLIGNHDFPSNDTFMTNEHAFTFLEEWESTTLVDRVRIETIENKDKTVSGKFILSPFIPTGRFEEALSLVMEPPYENIVAVFAHQEFRGAKMNTITSNKGDPWDLSYPLCISGHIHDYDHLQENLIYTGTPIQHGYGDLSRKTISLLHYEEGKEALELVNHERIQLNIPKKVCVTLTPNELLRFKIPDNTSIKIKVKGNPYEIKCVMENEHVLRMKEMSNVKFSFIETGHLKVENLNQIKPKVSFKNRLMGAIQSEDDYTRLVFKKLFG